MKNYNDEYYIAFRPSGDNQIYIKPDINTAKRQYHFKQLVYGEKPLFFLNGFKGEDKNRWPLTDLFVDSAGLLINKEVKLKMDNYDIDGMQIYPSIYIDDNNVWHENYWYLGFYKELDCLDRDNSSIETFDFDDDDDDELLEVKKFSLDGRVLEKIAENERLIFKIANCSKSYLFFHQKVVDFIVQRKLSGVRFIKVVDFFEGQQY
ncbi:imm11 family protein [Shewanella algae]|uniref:imm11 family protein n=1 Tax=Shewanella algae TaxID=38313 RepID=UPI0031F51203